MERVTYCKVCHKVSLLAGRRNKKRRPLCHRDETIGLLLCSCGFGVPLDCAGAQSNRIVQHDRSCPPLDAGRFPVSVLREIVFHFQHRHSAHTITLPEPSGQAPQTSRQPDSPPITETTHRMGYPSLMTRRQSPRVTISPLPNDAVQTMEVPVHRLVHWPSLCRTTSQ